MVYIPNFSRAEICYHDISVVSILWLSDTYRIETFLPKFRIFWSLKYSNSYEICGYIKFFLSKTRQNVSLIHIEYCFMCIVICIISLKINDTEP